MTGENEVEDIGEQFKNSSFTTKTHVISGDLELMTEVTSQAELNHGQNLSQSLPQHQQQQWTNKLQRCICVLCR
jgi:hypothetical protein